MKRSEKWKIENEVGECEAAFRFIDDEGDCQIEILISKSRYQYSTSVVNEICKDGMKKLTVKMNYK